MLDIRFIRENPDLVLAGAKKKHIVFDVKHLLEIDDRRRELLAEIEKMRAEQNSISEKVSQMPAGSEREALIEQVRASKKTMARREFTLREVMEKWQSAMLAVPNIPDASVPSGATDADNKEIRKEGGIPAFPFKPKDHVELMTALGMVDFERGAKVSGFRGYFLKNEGALLSFAIWQHAIDMFVKKGFTPMIVPSLVRRGNLLGTGYIPGGEEDLYHTQDSEYLAGTSEVATMGYFMDEMIPKEKLPIKIVAFSPCFRREAGAHGKDTKGLFRVHEFFKVEQVVLCEASHEESVKFHEEITANAEEFMQSLGLPYRVVINCGSDLGLGQVKKYDIEVWVPSEERYRETHSSSYFHDFQTRRLNIRYKDESGKTRFAHSLNSTAIPTPRPLIAIVENYQLPDGSIKIPKVLQKYIGKEMIKKI